MFTHMTVKILLPFTTFDTITDVVRMVVETKQGSFGVLPNRLDCAATLSAGILIYESESEGECFIAVDDGVFVKAGDRVLISVRRAIRGENLESLMTVVEQEFLALDETEKSMQAEMRKLEIGFLRRFSDFRTG